MRNIDADRPRKLRKAKEKHPSDLELGIFEVVQSGHSCKIFREKELEANGPFLYMSQHKKGKPINKVE